MTLSETIEIEGLVSLESAFADASAFTFSAVKESSEFLFTAMPSFDHAAFEKIYSRVCRV